jgi:hypothetical protein
MKGWQIVEEHGGVEREGERIHIWATAGSTRIAQAEPLANDLFLLEHDIFLPSDERAGYGIIVNFIRPEGGSYFWAEIVGQLFSVYTTHKGGWASQVGVGLSSEIWYRVQLLNRRDGVRVRVLERETGRVVVETDVPHDDGSPGRLEIGAGNQKAGTKTGAYFERIRLMSDMRELPPLIKPDLTPLKAAWELPDVGVEPVKNGLRLRSSEGRETEVRTRALSFNGEFDLSFTFRRLKEHRGGVLRITFLHPTSSGWRWTEEGFVRREWCGNYWSVELGDTQVALWTRKDGRWEERFRETLDLPRDIPLRVEVRNAPTGVAVTISSAEGKVLWQVDAPHDDGPPVPTALTLSQGSRSPGLPPMDSRAAVEITDFTWHTFSPSLPLLPDEEPLIQVENRWLQARWTSNGLWLSGKQPQHPSLCLGWTASLNGGPAGRWRRVKLSSAGEDKMRTVVEIWRDEGAGVELHITHEIRLDQPFLRTRLVAVNLDRRPKMLYFALTPQPDAAVGRYERGVLIFQRYQRWEDEPIDADLAGHPLKAVWGTREFAWDFRDYGWGSQLCLPLMALYRPSEQSAFLLFTDPRVPGTFQKDSDGGRWLHRFYLPPHEGARDEGINYGDGEGVVHTEVYTAFAPEHDWASLFNDFYLVAFPWALWDKPASDISLPPGGVSGISRHPFDEEWAKRAKEAGFSMFGFASEHMATGIADPDYYTNAVQIAHRYGLQAYLWDNIMVMPDTEKYRGWVRREESEPWERIAECDWRNFRDSLVADASGNTELDCWEGKAGNNSPRFSFGKSELARIQRLMLKHGFDGFFLDFYDQATGSDFAHRYGELPFYPLQVAQMEYTRALAEWLHTNRRWLIVNGPDVSFPVIRFADAVSHDMGDRIRFGLWYKCFTGYRPAIALLAPPSPEDVVKAYGEMIELGMFNGFCVPWYAIGDYERLKPEERERISELFRKTLPLSWELGRSRLIAGEPFRYYIFRHPDGRLFVTLRNEENSPVEYIVHAKRRWVDLVGEQRLKVSEWKLPDGWRDAGFLSVKQLEDGWALKLDAGETKVLSLIR